MAKRAGSTDPAKKPAKKPAKPRRKKGPVSITGLTAPEVTSDTPSAEIEGLSHGHHRLSAMRKLGARSILALVVPELSVAYQILAMNTEKGHNLREKSLEVIRMARSLAELDPRPEKDCALEFEEADYLTLGLAYEKRGRLSGGAYHPVLRRVEAFIESPLPEALRIRERRAEKLLALDDMVATAVAALKERGFTSPYLKAFVVARLNPLRFRRGATMSADEALEAMAAAAAKFDAEKVKIGDLAAAPPGPAEE
jgi:ParB family chromosome partitioning protein